MPPRRERRPAAKAGAALKSSTTTTSHSLPSPTAETRARRSWAYSLLRRCPEPPPLYGSREWLELPEGTPAKIGGVLIAAEAWARDAENLIDDLRREIDERRRVAKREEDLEYRARAAAHRREWSRKSQTGKSFAERRAEQLASAKARPGDYPGKGSA